MTAVAAAESPWAEFTVWMMPARRDTADARAALDLGQTPLRERSYVSRTELRRDHDADPQVRSAFSERFHAAGAASIEHAWRRIHVCGARSACARALAELRSSPAGHSIVAVLGLEPTAPMHANAHVGQGLPHTGHAIADVAKAYRLPTQLNGHGQTIAVIHFNGAFHASDLKSAMTSARLAVPSVRVDTHESERSSDDLELALDTQILATLANGASLVLYAGQNDARGYAEVIARALLDTEHTPHVISVSYGVPEAVWPHDAIRCIEQLFAAAALCGITVVAASGDAGAPLVDGLPQVDYPASSRLVLACGGTDLRLMHGRRVSEHVWNEGPRSSGGGYSRIFERTAWASQQGAHGRGVPDVAAHAASSAGYRVHLDDRILHVGGTSASAPLWAALIALMNEATAHSCGFISPLLYAQRSPELFYDVTVGGNGRYNARRGWDPCTGLGAPRGEGLRRWLSGPG